MREHDRRTDVKYILNHYPDCPQRDMALKVLRKGDLDLAHAWLDALDEMMTRGQSIFAESQQKKAQRSA